MKKFISVLLLLFLVQLQPGLSQAPLPDNFDEWIRNGMDQWDIPGLAIAIVQDDDVVYQKGFGVRKLGEADPVDEHTLFGIASVSKNMTAATLALLVDDGLLEWDDRVKDIIPWFELKDPWVTDEVRVKDLMGHRVGVSRMLGNRLQFMTHESREEILRRVRHLEFEENFRNGYVYSNIMYMAAGEIVAAVSGMSWDQFLKERLFMPIGMVSANTSITEISDDDNAAWPHQYIKGEVQTIPRRNWDNAAPAGGVNASVSEVAEWLRLQLGRPGSHNGKEIISIRSMREIHRPQVTIPIRNPYGKQQSYGMGWIVTDYEGHRLLRHGGATDGMNTRTVMLPELNMGLVVISNVHTQFLHPVVNNILDFWTDQPERDWNQLYWSSYQSLYEEVMERRRMIEDARLEGTSPTLRMEEYTGGYDDDLYGEMEIRQGNEGLEIHLWGDPDLVADLEHWHHDTFRAVWRNPAMREEFMHFTLGQNGKVATAEFQFTLRPVLLQGGAYPTDYFRVVSYEKKPE